MANGEKQKLVVSDSTYNRARKKTENGKSRSEMYDQIRAQDNMGPGKDLYSYLLQGAGWLGNAIDAGNTYLGNAIDKGFDNTIGALVNNVTKGAVDPRQWLSGEGVGTGLDLAEDLGLFALASTNPIGWGILGAKSLSQNADTMAEGLSGTDIETGKNLTDEQQAMKNLAGYGNFALMMAPGIGKGVSKGARALMNREGTGAFSKAAQNVEEAIGRGEYSEKLEAINAAKESAIQNAEAGVPKSIVDRAGMQAAPGVNSVNYGVPRTLAEDEVRANIASELMANSGGKFSEEILETAPEAKAAFDKLVDEELALQKSLLDSGKDSKFINPVYKELEKARATKTSDEGWNYRPSVQEQRRSDNFDEFVDDVETRLKDRRSVAETNIDASAKKLEQELTNAENELQSVYAELSENTVAASKNGVASGSSYGYGTQQFQNEIQAFIKAQDDYAAAWSDYNELRREYEAAKKAGSGSQEWKNYSGGYTGRGNGKKLREPQEPTIAKPVLPKTLEHYQIEEGQLKRAKEALERRQKAIDENIQDTQKSIRELGVSDEDTVIKNAIDYLVGSSPVGTRGTHYSASGSGNGGVEAYVNGLLDQYIPGTRQKFRDIEGIEDLLKGKNFDDVLKAEQNILDEQAGYDSIAKELGIRDLENASEDEMRELMIRDVAPGYQGQYEEALSNAEKTADKSILDLAGEEAEIEANEAAQKRYGNALQMMQEVLAGGRGRGLNAMDRWRESEDLFGYGARSLLPGYQRAALAELGVKNPVEHAQRIGKLLHEGNLDGLRAQDYELLDAVLGMGNSNPQAKMLLDIMAGGEKGLGLEGLYGTTEAKGLLDAFNELGKGSRAGAGTLSRTGKRVEKNREKAADGARKRYERKSGPFGTVMGLPADWAAMAGQGYVNAAAEYGPENTNQMIAQNPGLFASMALAGLLGRPFARRLPTLTGRRQMGPGEFGYKVSNVPYRMMAASAMGQNLSNQQVVDDGKAGQALATLIENMPQYDRGYKKSKEK